MGMDMLEGDLYSSNTVSELSNYIFTSKYSQYREDLKRRETWDECVNRVRGMHVKKFASSLSDDDLVEIIDAFRLIREKKVLPSARSLQYAGKAIEKNNVRMFNCATRHIDSIEAFGEYFFMLLSGCGVGVGITKRHLNKLPKFVERTLLEEIFIIPDTIEGWADSLKEVLKSYLVTGNELILDYSLIRPKGSPLKTSGGIAPGPDGLRKSHEKIKKILDRAVVESERLSTIDAYDILMHVADAVLSGGVRRSAVLVAFDRDDETMMMAKSGDWICDNDECEKPYHNHQRARSNNSVVLLRNRVQDKDIQEFIEHTRSHGEPGYIFADHPDALFNPCGEAGFIPILDNGDCGAQFCNLTNINGTAVSSEEDLIRCAKAAALIGTLQATYTDFPYLSYASKALTDDEALLGVSILGVLSNPLLYSPETQKRASQAVVETNEIWAAKLGINPAARCTLIKPDGQSALLLGSMLSGVHPAHSKKMFRRVQVNRTDPVYQYFRQHNPIFCEKSIWSAHDTDDIICFPIELKGEVKVKSDLTAIDHLEIIKSTQENWVNVGNTKHNRKPVSHSVSCTVVVGEDEWEAVTQYLYENRHYFSSVSLVPKTTDKLYKQAPMEAVTTRADMIHFGTLLNNVKPVDYSKMYEVKDNTVRQDTLACSTGVCELSF
jgi:ribonucleoside-triphosphate reductase (thioredoxin)